MKFYPLQIAELEMKTLKRRDKEVFSQGVGIEPNIQSVCLNYSSYESVKKENKKGEYVFPSCESLHQ
jgi:hypothetical protein